MILDFHTHTFPDRIAAGAIAKMQGDCHSAAFTAGTETALLRSMAEAGIHRSIVLPVATNPTKVVSINTKALDRDPGDGLTYFGCIHPAMEDPGAELTRIAAAGLRGIKLHPFYQELDFDDVRYLRILDRAAELGLIVVTHAGLDIGFPGHVRCSPAMIANALDQTDAGPLVLAHMGGWRNWDQVDLLADYPNVYLDTAFSLGSITPLDDGHYQRGDLPLLDDSAFCRLVHRFGAHRVLFGTDSPWDHQANARRAIEALPLTGDEIAAILGGNAEKLLRY